MILSSVPWWFSLGTLLAYALVAALTFTARAPLAARLLPWAWGLHALALVLTLIDWSGSEPLARFGFAPSLSMMVWCTVSVYMWEKLHTTAPRLLHILSLLALFAVGTAMLFPGQTHPHVQRSWVPLHWVLGFTSYGLVGAALLHATVWRLTERRLRTDMKAPASTPTRWMGSGIPLLRLETLTFRFVTAAFVALSLTLCLGVWHVRPWSWDHKSVFSVLAWAAFACLLLGRWRFGWRGRSAIRWLYAGSILLLLAYAGSRFVMEVILQRPQHWG